MTIDAAIVQRDGSQLSGKEFNLSSPLNFDRVKIDFLKFSMKVPEGLLNPTITWMWAELKDIENISSFRIWKQESSTESEVTVKSADIKQAGDVIVAVRVRPSIEHSSIALDYEYMKFLRILNPLEMFRIECLVPHCEWTVKSHLMVYANPFSVVRVFCQQHGSPIQLEIPEQYKGSDTRKPDIMVQKTGTNENDSIVMLIRNTLSGLVTIQGKCGEHSDFQFQVRSLRRADDHLLYCEFDRKVVTALRDNLRLKCRSMYVKMTLRVSIFVHSGILMHPMIANELELLTTPVRKKLQTIDGIRIMDEHDILLSSMPIGDISMNYALKIIVSSLERPSIVRIYELISLPPNYNEIITYNRILVFFSRSFEHLNKVNDNMHKMLHRVQYDPRLIGFEWKTVLQTIVLRVTSIVRAVEKLCVTKSTEYSSPCRSALAINDKLSAFLLKIKLDICNDKYTAEHLANLFSLMLNTPVTVGSATRFLINRYLMTIRSCEIRKMISTTLIQLSDNVRWYYAEANMARFERDMGGIYSNIADSDIDSTLSALGIANQLITELMINNTAFDGGRTFRVIRMRSSQFQSDVIAMVLRGFTRAELTRNPATFILFLNELVTLDRLDYGISKPKMIFALLGAESIRREYAGQKQTDKPLSKGMLMIRVPLEDPVVTPRFHNFYLCDHLHTLNMSFITNQYASHVTLRFGNLKLVRRITLQGKLTIGHHCFEIRNQFTNVSWYYFSSTINGTNSRSQIDSVTVEAKTNSKVCLIVKIAIEKSVPWISSLSCVNFTLFESSCIAHQSFDLATFYQTVIQNVCQQGIPKQHTPNVQLGNQTIYEPIEEKVRAYTPHVTCVCLTGYNYIAFANRLPLRIDEVQKSRGFYVMIAYILIVITLHLFVLPAVLARDRADAAKPAAFPVADCDFNAPYLYQISTFTGLQSSATSKANIYVRLIGTRRIDVARCLSVHDQRNNIFKRGSADTFIMSSYADLGDLRAINFWHDESGPNPSWYLRHCIVYDFYNDRTSYFCGYEWLSAQRGGGIVNRVFERSQKIDYTSFGHLFISGFCWLLFHYQYVISIFRKQMRSRCSRLRRFEIILFVVLMQLALCKWIVSAPPLTRIWLKLSEDSGMLDNWYLARYDILRSSIYVGLVMCIVPFLLIWLCEYIGDRAHQVDDNVGKRKTGNITVWRTGTPDEFLFNADDIPLIVQSITIDHQRYKRQLNLCRHLHSMRALHSKPRISPGLLNLLIRKEENTDLIDRFIQQQQQSHSDLNEAYVDQGVNDELLDVIGEEINIEESIMNKTGLNVLIEKKYERNLQAESVEKLPQEYSDSDESTTTLTDESTSKNMNINTNSTLRPKTGAIVRSRRLINVFKVFNLIVQFFLIVSCVLLCLYILVGAENLNYVQLFLVLADHAVSTIFALILSIILILILCILNALTLKKTDETYFRPQIPFPINYNPQISTSVFGQMGHLTSSAVEMQSVQISEKAKQLAEANIRERMLENSLIEAIRDLIGYMLFLILVIIISLRGMENVRSFHSTHTTIREFLTSEGGFQNAKNIREAFLWVGDVLEKKLFQTRLDYWCDVPDNNTLNTAQSACNLAQVPLEPFHVLKNVRVRQVRIKRFQCNHVPWEMSHNQNGTKLGDLIFSKGRGVKVCRADLDHLNFDHYYSGNYNCTGWDRQYAPCRCAHLPWKRVLRRPGWPSKTFTDQYGSIPVYYMMVLAPKDTPQQCSRQRTFLELSERQWIDDRTQLLLVDGNIYNPNTNIITGFTLSAELMRTGYLEKRLQLIHTTVHAQQSRALPNVVEFANYIYGFAIFAYFINEVIQFSSLTKGYGYRGVWAYVSTFANWLDGSLILTSFCYFGFHGFQAYLQRYNDDNAVDVNIAFVNYFAMAFNDHVIHSLQGLMIFVSILKLLNLLKFNPKTFLLTETIRESTRGFVVLVALYMVNLSVFAISGIRLFHSNKHFNTFYNAFVTSYTSVMKGSTSVQMFNEDSIIAAIWIVSLWIISQIIIQNFLISYVIEKFSHVRKTHIPTDEERVLGRVLTKITSYFGTKIRTKHTKRK